MIVDKEGRIFVILAGCPQDGNGSMGGTWDGNAERVVELLTQLREEGVDAKIFKGEDLRHRRGLFLALGFGVSFGGGQKVTPGSLCCNF